MPTRPRFSSWRKEICTSWVGITTPPRRRLNDARRQLRRDAHPLRPRFPRGHVLLFLLKPRNRAQYGPPDYADPISHIPFIPRAMQHQGRHNHEVGIVGDRGRRFRSRGGVWGVSRRSSLWSAVPAFEVCRSVGRERVWVARVARRASDIAAHAADRAGNNGARRR